MNTEIMRLDPADYSRCGNIWDMQRMSDLAEQMLPELISGNRVTYIYTIDGEFIGEISLVYRTDDPDYTIPDRRLYISRLIVKETYRRRGIGRQLLDFITRCAREDGYAELSIGVDLNNYPALKLYIDEGFDRVIFIGEDACGQYVKLLKTL